MPDKQKLFQLLLVFVCLACKPANEKLNMDAFLIDLSKKYRYQEGLANGQVIFLKPEFDCSWLHEGDIIIRFKSSQCLDCLIPFFKHISNLSDDNKSRIKLLATFDADNQLKSFLKKHKVDDLFFRNIDAEVIEPQLESLPGPFVFKISKEFTVLNVFILDKYFNDFNITYFDGLLGKNN